MVLILRYNKVSSAYSFIVEVVYRLILQNLDGSTVYVYLVLRIHHHYTITYFTKYQYGITGITIITGITGITGSTGITGITGSTARLYIAII